MGEKSGGLLGGVFGQLQKLGISARPQLIQNEIVITMTEEEFKNMALTNVDQRAKDNITIEFRDGKMTIRVRLF